MHGRGVYFKENNALHCQLLSRQEASTDPSHATSLTPSLSASPQMLQLSVARWPPWPPSDSDPGSHKLFKVQNWIGGPEVLIVFPLARLESVEKETEQNIFMTMAYQSGSVDTVGGEWVSVGCFYNQLVMNEKLNAGKVILIFCCLKSFQRQQKLLHFSVMTEIQK